MLILSVFLENTSYSFDVAYYYKADDSIAYLCKVGCRVSVPFGKYDAVRQGIIVDIEEVSNNDEKLEKLKPVTDIIDDEPILNDEMLRLLPKLKERYFCTVFQVLKLMIPTGLRYKSQSTYTLGDGDISDISFSEKQLAVIAFIKECGNTVKKQELVEHFGKSVSSDISELCRAGAIKRDILISGGVGDLTIRVFKLSGNVPKKLTQKQQLVYNFLKLHPLKCMKEICYYTSVGSSVIKTMEKNGVITAEEQHCYREPKYFKLTEPKKRIELSSEQQEVFKNLKNQYRENKASASLLYGVTGSGKTSVFMKLIEYVRRDKKSVILMVPEIALTAKLISKFKQIYGDEVAVFHSALSTGERFDEFKRVQNGTAKIVIGTRSAVFAPLENIGLIIIDEEQESSYKSSKTPTFHARDVAKLRCKEHNAMLLLCSATPSLESYYMAKSGRYTLNVLKNRYGTAKLPDVRIIDMNEELALGNGSIFSDELLERLNENLANKEQSILLLNRRGYHTFASCKMCGEPVTCPNCSISLTYHSANNRLMCHYCGYSREFSEKCPSCGKNFVRCSGVGTQRLEADLKEYLSNARILRMDADTTMAKNSHDKKLSQFENGENDIMIGTQMVAKGLDFENVTLVGVLLADQSLYSDEFRSYERAFDLFTQVVGRSGRGKKSGVAIIQTYTPENPIIKMAAEQNYDSFYDSEINIRHSMLYPPFSDICVVLFTSDLAKNSMNTAEDFLSELKRLSQARYREQPLRVFGPSPANVIKVSKKYRYKLIIKCKNNRRFREMMAELLVMFSDNKRAKKTLLSVDINPDLIP